LLILWWLLLLISALLLRPLIPVDETRYLSVAWEMWRNGDFLVPHLNGEAYAHKPPLLFWLMHAGWWVFGVNEIWPRLIAPLLSLACLYLVQRLATRLWPRETGIAARAPWVLFGTFVWLIFYTLVQFDMLLVFCTLLGMLGLSDAGRGRTSGWWLLSLAMGLGLLAKGPVILLHLLPAALLGPLWVSERQESWGRWYGALFLCVLGGAAMVLAWAIPAALEGGEKYRNAIFWGQTANRVVNSFAHREPWWWYLPMLPVLLLPWSLWPRLWKSAVRPGRIRRDPGMRFLASWILPTLVLFSLVSGKQIKYLLPLLPALALMIAWLLERSKGEEGRRLDLGALMLLLSGLLLLVLPMLAPQSAAWWIREISPLWGGLLLMLGFIVVMLPADILPKGVVRVTSAVVLILLAVQPAMMTAAGGAYDLREISQQVRQYQDQGRKLAYIGKYHGQFNFLGRLQEPVKRLAPRFARTWALEHPRGLVIIYDIDNELPIDNAAFAQNYRGSRKALKILETGSYLQAVDGN
jgi:4-amino-4-deoxy-L-arabinose transferase-like glycosyltransferase